MNKDISVIVPVYNRCNFCKTALKYLKNQTLNNIEFIIVDDGSTDGTYDYLVSNTKSDERFIIKKLDKNSGPSVARNLALGIATGKYIGFFDIDDEIPDDYFESLFNIAESNNSDIVFTAHNEAFHKKVGNIRRNLDEKIESLHNGALWDKLFLFDLVKKNKITFPEGRYCADNVFVFKMFYYAKTVTLTNKPVYNYVLQADSIGIDLKKQEKRKVDAIYITNLLVKFIKGKRFNKKAKEASFYFLDRSLNAYRQDKEFSDNFKKLTKRIRPKDFMMFILRLEKGLGLISKKTYNKRVLNLKVKHSGLFDCQWYLRQYPDVKKAKMNPVNHYLQYGWTEGRNPSPKFDNNYYLNTHRDVAAANICPLLHYIDYGREEGREIKSCAGDVNKAQRTDLFQYLLEYPVRVYDKYHRLKDKVKEIKRNK